MPPFNEKQEPAKEQCHLSINVENSPHSCLLVLGLYEGWVNVAKGGGSLVKWERLQTCQQPILNIYPQPPLQITPQKGF